MAAAAQTAAAAEAAAASLGVNIVDGRCRRLARRDTLAAFTASSHAESPAASACLGPKARKHDSPFGRLIMRWDKMTEKGSGKLGWV